MGFDDFLSGSNPVAPLSAGRAAYLESTQNREPVDKGFVGSTLEGFGRVLGGPANLVSRGIVMPAARLAAMNDPMTQMNLDALERERGDFFNPIYAGDIISRMGDNPLTPDVNDGMGEGFLKGAGRFALDVVADPLTYLDFGAHTALGKLSNRAAALSRAGIAIDHSAPMLEQAARILDEPVSGQLVSRLEKLAKSTEHAPLPEQIRAGVKSFANLHVPFTDLSTPLIGGEVGAALAKPFSAVSRASLVSRIGNRLTDMFPTVEPEVRQSIDQIARHYAGVERLGKSELQALREEVASATGIPQKALMNNILPIVDREVRSFAVRGLMGVAKPFIDTFKKLFSTNSGIMKFDELYNEFRNLMLYRVNAKGEELVQFETMLDDFAKKFGADRKKLDALITEEIERPGSILHVDYNDLGLDPANIGPEETVTKRTPSERLQLFKESVAGDPRFQTLVNNGVFKLFQDSHPHLFDYDNSVANEIMHQKLTDQQGSNPGGFYKSTSGITYYVKAYSDPRQVYAEALANRIYKNNGVQVPNTKIFWKDGKLHLATEKVEGATAKGFRPFANDREKSNFISGIAYDILMGNWDVIGLSGDNILTKADGTLHRVDNGSTFHFRAMGGMKDQADMETVTEFVNFMSKNKEFKRFMEINNLDLSSLTQQIQDTIMNFREKVANDHGTMDKYIKRIFPEAPREVREPLARYLDFRSQKIATGDFPRTPEQLNPSPVVNVENQRKWPRLLRNGNRKLYQEIKAYIGDASYTPDDVIGAMIDNLPDLMDEPKVFQGELENLGDFKDFLDRHNIPYDKEKAVFKHGATGLEVPGGLPKIDEGNLVSGSTWSQLLKQSDEQMFKEIEPYIGEPQDTADDIIGAMKDNLPDLEGEPEVFKSELKLFEDFKKFLDQNNIPYNKEKAVYGSGDIVWPEVLKQADKKLFAEIEPYSGDLTRNPDETMLAILENLRDLTDDPKVFDEEFDLLNRFRKFLDDNQISYNKEKVDFESASDQLWLSLLHTEDADLYKEIKPYYDNEFTRTPDEIIGSMMDNIPDLMDEEGLAESEVEVLNKYKEFLDRHKIPYDKENANWDTHSNNPKNYSFDLKADKAKLHLNENEADMHEAVDLDETSSWGQVDEGHPSQFDIESPNAVPISNAPHNFNLATQVETPPESEYARLRKNFELPEKIEPPKNLTNLEGAAEALAKLAEDGTLLEKVTDLKFDTLRGERRTPRPMVNGFRANQFADFVLSHLYQSGLGHEYPKAPLGFTPAEITTDSRYLGESNLILGQGDPSMPGIPGLTPGGGYYDNYSHKFVTPDEMENLTTPTVESLLLDPLKTNIPANSGAAISHADNLLPDEIRIARQGWYHHGNPEDLVKYGKAAENNPQYQAEVQRILAALPDEVIMFRGYNTTSPHGLHEIGVNTLGEEGYRYRNGSTDVGSFLQGAAHTSRPTSSAWAFKVKKKDIIGFGMPGENELIWNTKGDIATVNITNILNRIRNIGESVGGHDITTELARALQALSTNEYIPPAILEETWKTDPLKAGIQEIANQFKEVQARQLEIEMASGVKVVPLTADIDYLAHVLTPDARKALLDHFISKGSLPQSVTKANPKEMSTRLANALRRELVTINKDAVGQLRAQGVLTQEQAGKLTFEAKGKKGKALDYLDNLLETEKITEEQYTSMLHTMTINEVNAMAAQGKLIKGVNIPEFFHTNPAFATTARGIRGEKARTAVEFYKSMIDQGFALPIDQAPTHWMKPPQKELEGFAVDPEVHRVMNNWNSMMRNKKDFNAFLDLHDNVQNWWKAWTLAIFPGYHSRNFVGNLWNNWLGGVSNPKFYKQAADIVHGASGTLTSGFGTKYSYSQLNQLAKELGVIDRGFLAAEVPKILEQKLSEGKFLTLGTDSKFLKMGHEVGSAIENNARLTHFISKISEGHTPAEAAMSVKKYLFDYSELTDFERNVMKRLFPFYSWTRKNVPIQLQHLILEPAKFGAIYKTQHEFDASTPADERYLPKWMSENFPLRIRRTKDGKYEYFLLSNWLPAQDLAKLLKIHETAAQMLTPLPKEALQQMWNYDYFLKKKIEEIPGQKERFMGMNMPTRVTHSLKLIRALNEIDKMTKDDVDIMNKISGFLTGKTYLYDPRKAVIANKARVDNDVQTLRTALRREAAKSHPDVNEIQRIQVLMREAAKEY